MAQTQRNRRLDRTIHHLDIFSVSIHPFGFASHSGCHKNTSTSANLAEDFRPVAVLNKSNMAFDTVSKFHLLDKTEPY